MKYALLIFLFDSFTTKKAIQVETINFNNKKDCLIASLGLSELKYDFKINNLKYKCIQIEYKKKEKKQ